MKTAVTAKPTNRPFLTSLALLAAVTLAFAPSAQAGDQVPFRAAFDTVFDSRLDFPTLTLHLLGEGNATHLGLTTVESTDEQVDLTTGAATATCQFTAANGDEVVARFVFHATFDPSGTAAAFTGSWKITAGSGRFAGAYGSGGFEGWGRFIGPDIGVGHFTMAGTISSPGSLK